MTEAPPTMELNAYHEDLKHLYGDVAAKEREACLSLRNFVMCAWDVLEPITPLVWNWHMDFICSVLQKEAERIAAREPKRYDLIINVPPRTLKSTILSKCLPAWVWTRWPGQKFLTTSYSGDLALEHAVQCRHLIQSDWYQELWGNRFQLTSDQNVKSYYENDSGGYRMASSVGATATGRGGDWVMVDDALSADQAKSEIERLNCINWWKGTMYSRLNDQRVGIRIIIMQRLHEQDLTGYIVSDEQMRKHYMLVCLPAEETDEIQPKELARFYKSGLLFPDRLSRPVLTDTRVMLGDYEYAGQYLQRPAPLEGGHFKRQNWRYWKPRGSILPDVSMRIADKVYTCPVVELPATFDDVVDSWDCAFKELDDASYVVGQKWARVGADKFLLNQSRQRMAFPETVDAIRTLHGQPPRCSGVLIEDKANGPAVISQLKREIAGIIPVQPRGSKEARAMPYSRQQQAGNLYLPHPAIAKWVDEFISEHASFPAGANNDQVDSGSQAIDNMSSKRRVIPNYAGGRSGFRILFGKLSRASSLHISQWVQEDLSSSVVLAMWNADDARLAVYDEYIGANSAPEIVKLELQRRVLQHSHGYIKTLEPMQWIGNYLMFGRQKTAQTGNSRLSMKESYDRYQVYLEDNTSYDEAGAIMLMIRLFAMKSITLHTRCGELSRQLQAWSMDDKGNHPEEGYGLARALANLVSVLWENGKMGKIVKQLKPFSPEKARLLESMDEADRENRLGDWILNNELTAGAAPTDGGGWMI